MNTANLCPGCFAEKSGQETCSHCGYQEKPLEASLLYLAPRSLLVDKYIIGKVLGQGGFGITYLGWDGNLERKLAIKEFFPQGMVSRLPGQAKVISFTGEQSDQIGYGLERFLKEAKTLARFEEHPNIVTVRDFFKANSTAYMVMNYVEGVTLEQYLRSKGERLSFEQCTQIILPVLDALREVHEEGIMHRDISPDNILINKRGRVILIDFGAARQEMREKSKSLSVILKAGYAPEEQYRSRGKQGPWTDIYAVAATMYRCITGQAPSEAMDRLAEDDLLLPSELGISIDSTSEQVLLRALSVKAEKRYQSIEEFQEQLLERTAGKAEKVYVAAQSAVVLKDKQKPIDLVSSLSASVLAEEKGSIGTLGKESGPNQVNCYLLDYQSGTIPISAIPIGSRVVDPTWIWEFRTGNNYTGNGEKKPVTWIVVAKDHYEGLEPHVTLISEELIGKYVFDYYLGLIKGKNHWGESGTGNATHGLRPWLNSTGNHVADSFYHVFSDGFKAAVLETTLPNAEWKSGNSYGTVDFVFLPSTTELGAISHNHTYRIGKDYPYFSGVSSVKRVAKLKSKNIWYWTRSPVSGCSKDVSGVSISGTFGDSIASYDASLGVRPALNIKADVMVSEIRE